jgi:predicted dehydrogenase
MRLALFDVSHWHFPLYGAGLRQPGITIVGCCDAEGIAGQAVSQRFGCPLLSRSALLELDFDFALVFSRHVDMADVASQLIARRRSFLIEKPCGMTSEAVRRLDRDASAAGLHVAVPFILRASDLLKRLTDEGRLDPGGYRHCAFRFVPGPLSRYETSAPWMLRQALAGGGSAINVGVHFYDLLQVLAREPIVAVSGRTHRFRADTDVEELAVFTLTMTSGLIATVTTGYLYPSSPSDQREFSFSVAHQDAYFQGYADQLTVKRAGVIEPRSERFDYETDRYYPIFLADTLQRVAERRGPSAGLREAAQALAVVEAGYRSAAQGGETVAVEGVRL